MHRLAHLKTWQLWVAFAVLGVVAGISIAVAIDLAWRFRPILSVVGALATVTWAFVAIRRQQGDKEWLGS